MAVIAAYSFDTNFAATTEDANVAAGDATKHASLQGFGIEPGDVDYPSNNLYTQSTAVDTSEAVSENQYHEITVTADSGYELDLSSLTLKIMRGGTSGTRGFLVRSSVDGYASDLAGEALSTTYTWPTTRNVDIDLSGGSFQNLSTITFRFYSYLSSTSLTLHWDDVTLNGTVSSTGGGAPARIMTLNRRMW